MPVAVGNYFVPAYFLSSIKKESIIAIDSFFLDITDIDCDRSVISVILIQPDYKYHYSTKHNWNKSNFNEYLFRTEYIVAIKKLQNHRLQGDPTIISSIAMLKIDYSFELLMIIKSRISPVNQNKQNAFIFDCVAKEKIIS